MMKPLVAIIMGSDSDIPVMNEAVNILKEYGIGFEINVLSAHRTPDLLQTYIRQAVRKGVLVFIAAAGGAAHLPGVIAAQTTLPVIGVPISSELKGFDSLLSIVQMPQGIPVATMAIGKAGAGNSAIMAMEILAIKFPPVAAQLASMRRKMKEKVAAKNRNIKRQLESGK